MNFEIYLILVFIDKYFFFVNCNIRMIALKKKFG